MRKYFFLKVRSKKRMDFSRNRLRYVTEKELSLVLVRGYKNFISEHCGDEDIYSSEVSTYLCPDSEEFPIEAIMNFIRNLNYTLNARSFQEVVPRESDSDIGVSEFFFPYEDLDHLLDKLGLDFPIPNMRSFAVSAIRKRFGQEFLDNMLKESTQRVIQANL